VPVDTGFADWLKSDALYSSWTNATLPAGLQGVAVEQQIVTCLATGAGAIAEAARQGAFLGGPLAIDKHTVKGARRDLICKPVTLQIAALGYDAGVSCFVIDVNELDGGVTELTVLRPLT
jgi:hypothetical protein